MNWFTGLLYGLVSGITEFLPISSFAHQQLLLKLFGISAADPVQSLLIHVSLIAAVITGCRNHIEQLRRARQLHHRGVRGNNRLLELRFIKNAVLPFLICYFILIRCTSFGSSLVWIALFSFLNFLILMFQSRMLQGNKDERTVSVFDSVVVGAAGALSALPGVSRATGMLTVATVLGIEKQKAINWTLLLSIPALVMMSFADVLNLFSVMGRSAVSGSFLSYVFSIIGAYASGRAGILLMKSFASRKDLSVFAFYTLGVMMFALFLYLSVV